jgi:hypothetical protein
MVYGDMSNTRPIYLKGKDILMKNGLIVVKTNTFEREGHINEKWSYCRQDQYI